MISSGTPGAPGTIKILLLGSGELGKEVVIEAQRLGVEVVAVDSYAGAPAMQVAHRAHVIDMQDAAALRALVEREDPDFIVPEVEAIATDELLALEARGWRVVPTAGATRETMDRERIRRLAAEQLALPTSPYAFAEDEASFLQAVDMIGKPCVVKPVMSSSGKGQSVLREGDDALAAWHHALEGSRGNAARVIVEGFISFDSEITLLTVCHEGGVSFCEPIGHTQVDGDYRESWQPAAMSDAQVAEAKRQAERITRALGGRGVFGVEFFLRGEQVIFSELSPRPHDTGMVTMITQDLSQFALHVRAILGLPIPAITTHGPGASHAILASAHGGAPSYSIDPAALRAPDTTLRLFGKPSTRPGRRMGVALARAASTPEARSLAADIAHSVKIHHT